MFFSNQLYSGHVFLMPNFKHICTDKRPKQKALDWNTRMKIAAGVARAIEYLHDKMKPPIIYRDLKCSNILLAEDYHPKLSDFGLAKVGPVGEKTHVSTRVMGKYGYCAPEYAMTGQLTFKSDVYSVGVVLLEIVTGRKAIDNTKDAGEQNLVAWVSFLFFYVRVDLFAQMIFYMICIVSVKNIKVTGLDLGRIFVIWPMLVLSN